MGDVVQFEVQTLCPFCKRRAATRLCDAPMQRIRFCGHPPLSEMRQHGHFLGPMERLTSCDRPMCAECASEIAPDVDFCPDCMRRIVKKYHAGGKEWR